jgi:hypothetical protein
LELSRVTVVEFNESSARFVISNTQPLFGVDHLMCEYPFENVRSYGQFMQEQERAKISPTPTPTPFYPSPVPLPYGALEGVANISQETKAISEAVSSLGEKGKQVSQNIERLTLFSEVAASRVAATNVYGSIVIWMRNP